MNLVERTFELHGTEGLGAKPRPELMAPILAHVHGGLIDAVRMAFLHSSRTRGRIPAALETASEVRFVGHACSQDMGTLLRFEVPKLGDVAGDLFRQLQLWETGPRPEQTAFELFAESLIDIDGRKKDSDRYDHPMLRRVLSCRNWLRRGVEAITLPDAVTTSVARIDEGVLQAARELSSAVPEGKRVRITGRLDLLGVSQRVLKIHLDANAVVTALWEGGEPVQDLRQLINHDVVVEGTAVFRPSGSLLRLDADAIAPASVADESFRRLPVPTVARDYATAVRLRLGEKSVYAAIRGSIPAEESDEEFAAALAAMR